MVIGGSFYATMLAVFAFGIVLFKTQEIVIPPTLMAFVTLALLALAIFGGSYGMMSASWDPDKEGSALGAEEFSENMQILGDGFRKATLQTEYEKALELRNERRKLLEAKEKKKRELLNKCPRPLQGVFPAFALSDAHWLLSGFTSNLRVPVKAFRSSAEWRFLCGGLGLARISASDTGVRVGALALLLLSAQLAFLGAFLPRRALAQIGAAGGAALGAWAAPACAKRPEGVNRPELLPKSDGASTPVIDVARILTSSQKRELAEDIAELERVAQIRLRVLTQTFPNTPGLAIRDYWKPDGRTVIYVHDTGGLGDSVVNFNAGTEVEMMPGQVQNSYGNKFYIQEHGDSDTVLDVVRALKQGLLPEVKQ
ncbi:unnamed protein product [Effrenium voratum]|nr:unnamed protein product [Effrenium voratum]